MHFIHRDTYTAKSICLGDRTSICIGQNAFYLVDAINFIQQTVLNLRYIFCHKNGIGWGIKLIFHMLSVFMNFL